MGPDSRSFSQAPMRTDCMPAPKEATDLSTETTSISRIPQKDSHQLRRPPWETGTLKKSVLHFTYGDTHAKRHTHTHIPHRVCGQWTWLLTALPFLPWLLGSSEQMQNLHLCCSHQGLKLSIIHLFPLSHTLSIINSSVLVLG